MKLEQQIYTSGKPEFTTVAATDGLNRADRIHLENHSLYILPTSLMYQEGVETPVKYVFYPLGEDRLVVGRAVYTGLDSLGRPGNYLFHNFIVAKEDLLAYSRINPVTLIRQIEKKGWFRETVPENSSTVLEISPDEFPGPSFPQPELRDTLLSQLLYVCLNHQPLQYPLLLNGAEQDCLDFLERLYPLLPYYLRAELSFDTFTYNVSLNFRVVGLPERPEFRQSLPASFTLHPDSLQASSALEAQEPSRYLSLITGMIAGGQMSNLDTVYTLEHYLRTEDYPNFNRKYDEVSRDLKDVILDFHRETLLYHIADQQDAELLQLIQVDIQVRDMAVLASSAEMIHWLVATEDAKTAQTLTEWLCLGNRDVAVCYPFLFEFHSFWQVFLEHIKAQPQAVAALVGPLQAFSKYYAPQYEETLLDALFPLLPFLREEKKVAKGLFKAFEALPQPNSDTMILLRTAIKLDLSREDALLEQLLARDLKILADERKGNVLDVMVRGVFKTKDAEDIEKQLHGLFATARENPESLLRLLHVIEKIEFSKKVREVLKKILEASSKAGMSAEIVTSIQRILKPPPSLFARLKNTVMDTISELLSE